MHSLLSRLDVLCSLWLLAASLSCPPKTKHSSTSCLSLSTYYLPGGLIVLLHPPHSLYHKKVIYLNRRLVAPRRLTRNSFYCTSDCLIFPLVKQQVLEAGFETCHSLYALHWPCSLCFDCFFLFFSCFPILPSLTE